MSEPLNVLIIDDDELLRRLLTEIVTRAGHIAVPAQSAEAGLELLPFWTFQIAILDHHLPGMEGIVLGEFLRSNNPDMAVALVTGADFAPPIARYAAELGASFAVKSVPDRIQASVIETVKRCLNDLRSVGRYTEHSRVLALAGLLTAKVLDLDLPRLASGRTLYEEYDALMQQHGRRLEFEGEGPPASSAGLGQRRG